MQHHRTGWLAGLLLLGLLLIPGLSLAATCAQNGGTHARHRPEVFWHGHYPGVDNWPSAPDNTPYLSPLYTSPSMAMADIAAHAEAVDTDCSGFNSLYGVQQSCGNGVVSQGFASAWSSQDYCVGEGCVPANPPVGAPWANAGGGFSFQVFGFDGIVGPAHNAHPVYTAAGIFGVYPVYRCGAGVSSRRQRRLA